MKIKVILQDEFDFSYKQNEPMVTQGIGTCFGVSIRDTKNRHQRVLAHISVHTIISGTDSLVELQKNAQKGAGQECCIF